MITALTVALPDAAEFAAALTAVTGAEPTFYPAVTTSGEEGRVCTLAGIEVFEVPAPAAAPESITLNVPDTDAAVARLRQAGYTVVEHVGLPVAATVTVEGCCIRIAGTPLDIE